MRKKMGDGVERRRTSRAGDMGNVVRIVPPTRDAVIHLDAFETEISSRSNVVVR